MRPCNGGDSGGVERLARHGGVKVGYCTVDGSYFVSFLGALASVRNLVAFFSFIFILAQVIPREEHEREDEYRSMLSW